MNKKMKKEKYFQRKKSKYSQGLARSETNEGC